MSVTVTLPDGNQLELPDGATGADAAAAIGPGLARAALAIEISAPGGDGATGEGPEVRDLARPLPDGAHIAILTKNDGPQALQLIRHDAAHVLAAAVMELYPGVKISIGPPIEDGFYYDFEFPDGVALSEAAFPQIEELMRAHVKAAEPFEREDVPVGQARERFLAERQDYKVELIDDLVTAAAESLHREPLRTVSLYTNGPFTDLCRGPHAPSTKTVGAFKLSSVAGAYWRGDSTRTMLTRIYGTAFFTRAELEEHLERLEQARARDHRKLGRELGLFTFSDVSPGAAFWMPAGTTIFNSLVALSRQMGAERGYSEVKTPQIFDAELWRTSGHWDKYRENMFTLEVEGREMAVKPMNCPGHCHLFAQTRHSYRDLPVRYFEPGLLHRNEASGVLHGLLRVRHFAQDDAHIFCTEEQVQERGHELRSRWRSRPTRCSTSRCASSSRPVPSSAIGTDEMWDRAEAAARARARRARPRIRAEPRRRRVLRAEDRHARDRLARALVAARHGPARLLDAGALRAHLHRRRQRRSTRPVMIHRALLGSYERFIGIMLEHYAGELPLWLAPVQAIVLPVSDRFNDYAAEVIDALRDAGARAELDERSESVARKIRDAELRKIPYMLVVGEREQRDGTVSVREHGGGDAGSVPLKEFTNRLAGELYSAPLTPRKSSHSHA